MFLMTKSLALQGVSLLLLAGAGVAIPRVAHADPTARECAAASEDALSLRKQEKLKDAKDKLLVCSAPTCPGEVRDECARRMTDLTAAQPTVVFDVKDAQGGDLSAVRVSLDGALLVDHLGGAAVAVDAGDHTFVFEASGQTVEKKVVVRESEKGRTIQVSFGGATPAGAAAAPAAVDATGASATAAPAAAPADQGASSWNGQKTAAVVIGGAGIVGVAVGSIFGLQAFSKWSTAKTDCSTYGSCGSGTLADSDKSSAQSAATVSTIAFVVGGAAVVGGAILWFTAPSGSVQVGPTVGGMAMRGTF
jgi:hypothetical protein